MSRRIRPESSDHIPLTYEANLGSASAEHLKRFAEVWIGKEGRKLSKGPARAAIAATMRDPAAIRAAIARLTDLKRAGLGLVKLRGQTVDTDALAGALLMLGFPTPKAGSYDRYSRGEPYFGPLESLLNDGLLMLRRRFTVEPLRTSVDPYRGRPLTFADARVLAESATTPPLALDVEPVRVRAGTAKGPGEVALRLVATAEGIARLGGLAITGAGYLAKPSVAKLAKVVAWKSDSVTGAAEETDLFLELWLASGLLVTDPAGRTIALGPDAATLLDLPYDEQAPLWARAYESITGWYEYVPKGARFYGADDRSYKTFNALRGALLVALAALPDPDAWYAARDLSDAMYARGGEWLALGSVQGYYAPYAAKPEEAAKHRERWRNEQRQRWTEREAPWIERALAGPLFHLGFVEIASEGTKRGASSQAFRLTAVGRRALWDAYRPETSPPATARPISATQAGCWVVQPNFEVVVFFDAATPGRLRFLERVGERLGTEGAAATYRLTRERVYGALESGLTLGSILDALAESARYPVPDAVIRTVTGWAARRERLTVRRGVGVLEFDDAASRDAALARGRADGEAVGDRFVLLPERTRPQTVRGVIDYAAAPARCLSIAEDGLVRVAAAKRDLLVESEIAAWCDPASSDGSLWHLTRESVTRAAARGWKPAAILDRLARRSIGAVPALVRVAVEAWAGGDASRTPVAAAAAPVLLVGDDAVADAIAESETTRGFLECRVGPRAFLVRPAELESLRAALAALGLAVGRDASDERVVRAARDDSE